MFFLIKQRSVGIFCFSFKVFTRLKCSPVVNLETDISLVLAFEKGRQNILFKKNLAFLRCTNKTS